MSVEENSDISMYDIKMSVRTYNILLTNEIKTIEQLSKLDRKSVLKFRGCGKLTLDEIEKILDRYGLKLQEDAPPPYPKSAYVRDLRHLRQLRATVLETLAKMLEKIDLEIAEVEAISKEDKPCP